MEKKSKDHSKMKDRELRHKIIMIIFAIFISSDLASKSILYLDLGTLDGT